jgi:hypothetical protein
VADLNENSVIIFMIVVLIDYINSLSVSLLTRFVSFHWLTKGLKYFRSPVKFSISLHKNLDALCYKTASNIQPPTCKKYTNCTAKSRRTSLFPHCKNTSSLQSVAKRAAKCICARRLHQTPKSCLLAMTAVVPGNCLCSPLPNAQGRTWERTLLGEGKRITWGRKGTISGFFY